LSGELKLCQNKLKEMQQIDKLLSEDLQQVQGTIASAVSELQNANGLSMERFDQSNEQHLTTLLPRLRTIDGEVFNVLTHFQEAQMAMRNLFADGVSMVAELQKSLMDENNKLAALSESLSRKQELFDQLVKVKKLPQSYVGCLEEVVRRRAFGQVMSKELSHWNEIFNQYREKETIRRIEFLHEHGWNLPSDLVAGLSNKPGVCELRYQHLEDGLPLIESFQKAANSNEIVTQVDIEKQLQQSLVQTLLPPVDNKSDLSVELKNTQKLLKEKALALTRQKEEFENELKKWQIQNSELKKERNSLKYELESYQLPVIEKSRSGNNVEDSLNLLEAQLSKMFGNIQDPMVLSRVNQYFTRALNENNNNNNNNNINSNSNNNNGVSNGNNHKNKDQEIQVNLANEIMAAEMDSVKAEALKLKTQNDLLSDRVRKLNYENEALREEPEPKLVHLNEMQEALFDLKHKYTTLTQESEAENRRLLLTIKELTEELEKSQKDSITNGGNVKEEKDMEKGITNFKGFRICIDENFNTGDLLLFKRIAKRAAVDHSKEKESRNPSMTIYMAFISDSNSPCFLEGEFVSEMKNTPEWIVGKVARKKDTSLKVKYNISFIQNK
ncbi:Na+ ABC transporter, ATP-binding component, partial [Reticulomyxa filosa]